MKLFLPLLVLTTLTSPISAYWKGFNIKSNLADGVTCKSAKDWAAAFAQLKTFPNKINSARLYSSHTCNTLLSAVPSAISSHTFILVGILATTANFEAEKGALLQAVKQYGFDWVAAISVGSEDLYRGTHSPSQLASQIYDVRGMLQELPGWNGSIKVGHVDTTNAWTNTSNREVIRACDFIGTDIYPYFQTLQDNNVSNSYELFWNGVKQVQNAVTKAGSTASVWVTETGWPVNGATKNNAIPGTTEARTYWSNVACMVYVSGLERGAEFCGYRTGWESVGLQGSPSPCKCSRIAQIHMSGVYSPLSSSRSIRILILELAYHYEDTLRCSLKEIQLPPATWFEGVIHKLTAASYEAVSYVWGSSTRDHSVVCDGKTIFLTANCDQAPRDLRCKGWERTLWVDSTCINQESTKERSAQLNLMGDAYEIAERTLVWLGPSNKSLDALFFDIFRFSQLPRWMGYFKPIQTLSTALIGSIANMVERLVLESLDAPRDHSINQSSIICGHNELPWANFEAFVNSYREISQQRLDWLRLTDAKFLSRCVLLIERSESRSNYYKHLIALHFIHAGGSNYYGRCLLWGCGRIMDCIGSLEATIDKDRVYGTQQIFSKQF
ncbi:uncharacterized protein PAC_08385 [Phialocephala subalpina]|uniref:Probable glucan endo-1,3-beta-glucosidase eglC n=1 Tax=Phialocephala subalpina TaxID=576137 RepID=A0A1L7X0F8_9HELO|nr:uncharacterized protein PAC_08385 [Phialocephala subalpina]